jgi:hypothetical protein
MKARPQRQRRQHQLWTSTADGGHEVSRSNSSKTPDPDSERPSANTATTRSQVDVYELVKGLVQENLRKEYGSSPSSHLKVALMLAGYSFECVLVEPHASVHDSNHSSASISKPVFQQPELPLSLSHVEFLLEHFNRIMGWPHPQLVDTQDLLTTARTFLGIMVDLSAEGISTLLKTTRLPMDSTALLFAALALGAVAMGDLAQSRFLFEASLEMVKLFANQQTLDLCLAYYLQHLLALRFGTSAYAQGIMAHTFLVAHHLGIQRNSHGNAGLRLFLLIYMADQYDASPMFGGPRTDTAAGMAQLSTTLNR